MEFEGIQFTTLSWDLGSALDAVSNQSKLYSAVIHVRSSTKALKSHEFGKYTSSKLASRPLPLQDEVLEDEAALPFPHEEVSPSPGPSTSSDLYAYPVELGTATTPTQIIRLNIGGVQYTTTRATLSSRGSNFFGPLFDGKFGQLKDAFGAYFIDRNGRWFGPILDYLRQGVLLLPSDVKIEQIVEEAKFYAIDLLPGLCGDIKEGLYTSNNWILLFERDPDHPWIFGITGT